MAIWLVNYFCRAKFVSKFCVVSKMRKSPVFGLRARPLSRESPQSRVPRVGFFTFSFYWYAVLFWTTFSPRGMNICPVCHHTLCMGSGSNKRVLRYCTDFNENMHVTAPTLKILYFVFFFALRTTVSLFGFVQHIESLPLHLRKNLLGSKRQANNISFALIETWKRCGYCRLICEFWNLKNTYTIYFNNFSNIYTSAIYIWFDDCNFRQISQKFNLRFVCTLQWMFEANTFWLVLSLCIGYKACGNQGITCININVIWNIRRLIKMLWLNYKSSHCNFLFIRSPGVIGIHVRPTQRLRFPVKGRLQNRCGDMFFFLSC